MGKYYFENNFSVLTKIDNNVPYIYKQNHGWIPDHFIIHCQMGGSIDYEEITEEEAYKRIKEIEHT